MVSKINPSFKSYLLQPFYVHLYVMLPAKCSNLVFATSEHVMLVTKIYNRGCDGV